MHIWVAGVFKLYQQSNVLCTNFAKCQKKKNKLAEHMIN